MRLCLRAWRLKIRQRGQIGSRYFYGIEYEPRQIKFAIMDSAQSKIGNPVDQLLLYCYHYNPATGKYGLQILTAIRIGAIILLLGMGGMFFVFRSYNKKKTLG